jgi:hypothetical protein
MVRRAEHGRDLPLEEGWVENALLAALDALAVGAPAAQGSQLGPYRAGAGAGERRDAPLAEPILLERLLEALTGGRPNAIGWLRGILKEEARRARSALANETVTALTAELHEAFRVGIPHGMAARGILAQVQTGLGRKG